MKKRHHYILAFAVMLLSITMLKGLAMATPLYANNELLYSYKDNTDGIIDGSKDFIIPAKAGENFDIEIVFTGTSNAGDTISIAFDRVTDDQMIPNTQKGADDRSGLLNETVKKGTKETRKFSVAAIDGDITITVTGKGQVLSIKAVKQEAKTAGDRVTVYSIGDSLVQTYNANYAPQTGWGQTLSLYFNDNVSFVNRAIGGRSTGNFMRQGRLNEVLCEIRPGDVVLIEFGHNDSNSSNGDRFVSTRDFKYNLEDVYIKGIRDRGGIPVLVTLCNRNQCGPKGEFSQSYGEYVTATIQTAEATNTLLIDLNAWTLEHFEKLNFELGAGTTSDIIYNHAIAGAYEGNYSGGVSDNTHLQYYGAKLVSGYISEQLKAMNIPGVSEHYVPLSVTEIPAVPTGIEEKKHEKHLSRIKWTASENADYYKVMMAEVVETSIEGVSAPVYALADEFELAGYTTIPDFAHVYAKEGEHYAYKITAINAAGESAESVVFSFGLLTETGESIIPEPETTTIATTQNPLDTPAGMFKILFFATLPFTIGILFGLIALFFKSLKNRKKQK